jgi:hypothetical protein
MNLQQESLDGIAGIEAVRHVGSARGILMRITCTLLIFIKSPFGSLS